MPEIIPALLKKRIAFRRLSNKSVISYEIYGDFKDSNYASGIRTELLDTVPNPVEPSPSIKKIKLEYNDNATWELPADAYLDRDHQFRLFMNNFIVSSLCFSFNRVTKMITLDTNMKELTVNDTMELEYYQDLIVKEYMLEDDCIIHVKPIFTESYTYGKHNVII